MIQVITVNSTTTTLLQLFPLRLRVLASIVHIA